MPALGPPGAIHEQLDLNLVPPGPGGCFSETFCKTKTRFPMLDYDGDQIELQDNETHEVPKSSGLGPLELWYPPLRPLRFSGLKC